MRSNNGSGKKPRYINGQVRKDSKAKLFSLTPSRVSQSSLPQLTINSLILLGFNTDEYLELYSGIAFDLLPLSPTSFDKDNEKMLVVILHYLLLILDQDEFSTAIQPCFPYLDAKEKRKFFKAVLQCIQRLRDGGHLPSTDTEILPLSLLAHPSGERVWQLLKILSDKSMDVMIERYHTQLTAQHQQQRTQPDDDEFADVIDGVAVDAEHDTPQPHSLPIHYNEETEEDTMEHIQNEFSAVRALMLEMDTEHHESSDYLVELEQRLYEVTRRLRKLEVDVRDQHLLDEHHVLTEQGALKRERLIDKIEARIILLQQFLDTQLMNKVVQYLDNNEVDDDALSVSSSGSTPAAGQRMASSPPAFQRSIARLNSMKTRAPVTLEEMEKQQTNLRDVLDGLVHKIDEVSVYL